MRNGIVEGDDFSVLPAPMVRLLRRGSQRFNRSNAATTAFERRRRAIAAEQTTLWVRSVEVAEGRATVQGEVWLGPVAAGSRFTATSRADEAEAVDLVVAELREPAEAQEAGRVARVVAVLTGDGMERVRPDDVLRG